jgi:hypothetical protein
MKDLKKQIMDILEEKHGVLILTGDMEELMFKIEALCESIRAEALKEVEEKIKGMKRKKDKLGRFVDKLNRPLVNPMDAERSWSYNQALQDVKDIIEK